MPRTNKGKGKTYDFLYGLVGHQGDECVKWPFYTNPNGYGQLGWHGRNSYPHIVMCELTHGPAPEGHEAAHSCGNGNQGCCNPRHLSWKTKSQNRHDALKHGTGVTQRSGSRGSLKPEQVKAIRALEGKMLQREIAAAFGISEPRVRAIFANKIYRSDPKIKKWMPDDDRKIKAAIAEGCYLPDIAKLFGKSERAIMSHCHRAGISMPRRPQVLS